MIGKTINHFEITAELGRGGMGVVYRAHDTTLDRDVALKFLPPHLTADKNARARFIHEAKAASSLQHPAICAILEFGETDDGQTYLVMPCYEGETLEERLKGGHLSVEEAVTIFRQVAQGLAAAHEKGIVHRDIKPANIFLTKAGQAVILDFGLAKLAGQTQLTQEGTTLGTVAYMSPEQVQGEEAGPESDFWSLGAVLFEMLTGKPPFTGEHPQAVMYAIGQMEIPGLPGYPREVIELVQGLLEKDRTERGKAITELLPRYLEGGTVQLSGGGSNRWLGPVVVVVALLLVGGWLLLQGGAEKGINSIAVLPFEDLSAEMNQQYVSDGMTDQLISRLGTLGVFDKVISRRSVMRYKEEPKPVAVIAKELDVRALVEGTIVLAGDRARVTATLIDAVSDKQLWSDSFDEEVSDILDLQNRVVRSIVAAIDKTLSPEVQKRLTGKDKVDPRAYRAYLQGMKLLYEWDYENLDQIESCFLEAIAADSTYAPAFAGLAEFHTQRTHTHSIPPSDAVPQAKKYLAKAFALDPDLAEGYLTQGHLQWEHEFKFKEAEESFRKSIELNPNLAWSHLLYAYYLTSVARNKEAAVEAMKAVELDPFTAVPYVVWAPLRNAGHSDRALELIEEYESLNPEYDGWQPRVFIFTQRQEWDRAVEYLEKRLEGGPEPDKQLTMKGVLAEIYLLSGQSEPCLQILVWWEPQAKDPGDHIFLAKMYARVGNIAKSREHAVQVEASEGVSPMHLASMYAVMGDMDRAFEYLEKSYDLRINWMTRLGYTQEHPLMKSGNLKEDPRFEPLLKKVGIRN